MAGIRRRTTARFPLTTPGRLKTGVERMHRELEKVGRDPASIDIAYIFFAPPTWQPQKPAGWGAADVFRLE